MTVRRLAIAMTTTLLLAAAAPAQDAVAPPSPLIITGYWENDGGPLKPNNNQDRHYTNGLAFTFAHQPGWARDFGEIVPFAEAFDDDQTTYAGGYAVGQLIFTPDNINLKVPPPNDRPYAGYLYAGVYWQRADDDTFDHLQFDLGIVGPSSAAEDVQDGVHDMVDAIDPQGWDSQLHDEPTFQFHLRRKWRMWLLRPDGFAFDDLRPGVMRRGLGAELIPMVGTSLGTVYVNAEVGAVARIGWNLPDDFGPGRLADFGAATGERGGADWWHAYVYGRTSARFVAHDIFLDAGTFEDNPGLGQDLRHVVGEFQLGAMVGVEWRSISFVGGYSQTFQTETFEGQYTGDEWGALTLSLTIWQ
jgi:lipid A 3-O-deacylase